MLEIIFLENCFFSKEALKLIKQYRLKYKIIFIKKEEKNISKAKYKILSFPQIYLVRTIRYKTEKINIGGYDNFKSYIEIINYLKNSKINLDILNSLIKLIKY